jgi:hypothetical protein
MSAGYGQQRELANVDIWEALAMGNYYRWIREQ